MKTSVFDLQMDPSHSGLQMHRLENAKDPDFWSARVSRDVRLIIHRSGQSLLVCYVGHHDAAYAWAEKRKLTAHPKTGALQIVEIRELVQEIPVYVQAEIELPEEQRRFRLIGTRRSWNSRWHIRGKNGQSSCIHPREFLRSAPTTARHVSLAPLAPGKPSSLCIAPRSCCAITHSHASS